MTTRYAQNAMGSLTPGLFRMSETVARYELSEGKAEFSNHGCYSSGCACHSRLNDSHLLADGIKMAQPTPTAEKLLLEVTKPARAPEICTRHTHIFPIMVWAQRMT